MHNSFISTTLLPTRIIIISTKNSILQQIIKTHTPNPKIPTGLSAHTNNNNNKPSYILLRASMLAGVKLCTLGILLIFFSCCIFGQSIIDSSNGMDRYGDSATIECHRRPYSYKVTQFDENGKKCEDIIVVQACWGRCDSKEISDWRFPYKKSNHPVCVHYGRNRKIVSLEKCEQGALPSASLYEYLEAADCKCQQCSSSDTSCEGLRYRPQRSHPDSLGFEIN